jgi:hypothetical protein
MFKTMGIVLSLLMAGTEVNAQSVLPAEPANTDVDHAIVFEFGAAGD